jgi:sigma-B regulation protein RsbU (phosphoserine phosphatase)
VLLIVADVAGKGVPAALIMSALRASVHVFSSMNLSLEELMHRLNAQVYESTSSGSYVTLFLAEIDTAGNSITYVNAGHPPPILHSNGQISLLDLGTVPVGMFPKLPSFRAATEDYFPGTTLVACTDGVWERSSTAGALFGECGLQEFVLENATTDGPAFCHRLSEQVRQFGENRPLEDDATLVVARFGVAGEPPAQIVQQ